MSVSLQFRRLYRAWLVLRLHGTLVRLSEQQGKIVDALSEDDPTRAAEMKFLLDVTVQMIRSGRHLGLDHLADAKAKQAAGTS